MITGSFISDNRGLHSNQYKTDESVWESMREFLSLTPSQTSHYRSTETDKSILMIQISMLANVIILLKIGIICKTKNKL